MATKEEKASPSDVILWRQKKFSLQYVTLLSGNKRTPGLPSDVIPVFNLWPYPVATKERKASPSEVILWRQKKFSPSMWRYPMATKELQASFSGITIPWSWWSLPQCDVLGWRPCKRQAIRIVRDTRVSVQSRLEDRLNMFTLVTEQNLNLLLYIVQLQISEVCFLATQGQKAQWNFETLKTRIHLAHAGSLCCFHNPPNSDMHYTVFNERMRSILHVHTPAGTSVYSHIRGGSIRKTMYTLSTRVKPRRWPNRTALMQQRPEPVHCCFTSTETIRTIRKAEPRPATSTFTQLLRPEFWSEPQV